MNNLIQLFNQVFQNLGSKPLNILCVGADNTQVIGVFIEYCLKVGGKLTIGDTNVENLKGAKNLFSEFLGKFENYLFLGRGDNFVDPSLDLIFISNKDKEETIACLQKVNSNKTLVLVYNFKDLGVNCSQYVQELDLAIFVPSPASFTSPDEFINEITETGKVLFNEVAGEKFLVLVPYGTNRNLEIAEYHKKVMIKMGIKTNYFKTDAFSNGASHGHILDHLINITKEMPFEYYLFLDIDSFPLRKDYLNYIHDKVKSKDTLFSAVGASNHKLKPNTAINKPYAYACGMCLSKELFQKLGSPSLHEFTYGDTAEILTHEAERLGFNVCFMWPSKVVGLTDADCEQMSMAQKYKTSEVGNWVFGFGTTFGQNIFYHQMNANCARAGEEFIKKAKEILNAN